jgi:hypothetical protein
MRASLLGEDKTKLIDLILDARGEARDHRLKAKEHKQRADDLAAKVTELSALSNKTPELEAKLSDLNGALKSMKDSEKARREALLAKLPKEQGEPIKYMTNVDAITSDQFDATVDLLLDTKKNGMSVQPPGPHQGGEKNPFKKGPHFNIAEQSRLMRENPTEAKKLQSAAN